MQQAHQCDLWNSGKTKLDYWHPSNDHENRKHTIDIIQIKKYEDEE